MPAEPAAAVRSVADTASSIPRPIASRSSAFGVHVDSHQDGGTVGTGTTSDVLEALLVAAGLSATAVAIAAGDFPAFEVDGAHMAEALERERASIDAAGHEVADLADILVVFGKRARSLSISRTDRAL